MMVDANKDDENKMSHICKYQEICVKQKQNKTKNKKQLNKSEIIQGLTLVVHGFKKGLADRSC